MILQMKLRYCWDSINLFLCSSHKLTNLFYGYLDLKDLRPCQHLPRTSLAEMA